MNSLRRTHPIARGQIDRTVISQMRSFAPLRPKQMTTGDYNEKNEKQFDCLFYSLL